jgi:hypothetical protein
MGIMTALGEDQAKEKLRRLSDAAVQWAGRRATPGGFAVAAGSALVGDDNVSNPFQVSTALITCLDAAIDHLHGLYALVLQSGFLHVNTPATIARGALESASTAIWIAKPPGRDERVRRTLAWFWQDVRDGDTAATGAGITVPTELSVRQDKLKNVAAARGLDPKSITSFTSTEAVKSAKEHLGTESIDVLLMWRLCSGFAHGRAWPNMGFAGTTNTPLPGRPDMTLIKVENSYERVLAMALASHQATKAAIDLFDQRAGGR